MTDLAAGVSQPLRVGFIGLGQMGRPMATRLANWPGGLVVYDARPEAMTPLTDAGAKPAGDVGDVATQADIICLMVRADREVAAVVRDLARAVPAGTVPAGAVPAGAVPAGAVLAARQRTIIAIHSTIAPDTAPELAAEVGENVEIVDAPVSGGFMGAEVGRLAVMFGGSREAYERCREPFGYVADLVMYMGDVGAGTRAKLARNLLHFVAFTAAAEAQQLAEAAGIDLRKLARVVRHSDAVTGGAGSIMVRSTTEPLDSGDPLRPILEHARSLGEKDLALALDLGRQLGIDLPMARYALDHFGGGLGLHDTEQK